MFLDSWKNLILWTSFFLKLHIIGNVIKFHFPLSQQFLLQLPTVKPGLNIFKYESIGLEKTLYCSDMNITARAIELNNSLDILILDI